MTKFDIVKIVIAMVLGSLALGAVLFYAVDALLWPERGPALPSAEIAAPAPPAAAPAPPVINQERIELFAYSGIALPSAADGWERGYAAYEAVGARIENGELHITDRDVSDGSAIGYSRTWQDRPGYLNVAEFDVKVVSVGGAAQGIWPSGYVGIFIGTSDGKHNMVYTLYPDRILSSYADSVPGGGKTYRFGNTHAADTTGRFITYKAVIENGIAKLSMNGTEVLSQPAGRGVYDLNGVEFGSGSSQATGEAYFRSVRAYQIPVPNTKREALPGS